MDQGSNHSLRSSLEPDPPVNISAYDVTEWHSNFEHCQGPHGDLTDPNPMGSQDPTGSPYALRLDSSVCTLFSDITT